MRMIKSAVVLGLAAGIGLAGSIAQASDDPIATRQAIMSSVARLPGSVVA